LSIISATTLALATALAGAAPNGPPPPPLRTSEIAVMPPAEDARIAELTAAFFEDVRRLGLEETMRKNFAGDESVLAEANIANYQKIDAGCGKLSQLELVETRNLGTRAAKRMFVTVHGTCLIRWELAFKRLDKNWAFTGFHFKTIEGRDW
jgi:hypothetical protein